MARASHCLLALFAAVAYVGVAQAGPVVGPEMPVDSPAIVRYGGGEAALAWNGQSYVAAWQELRRGSGESDAFVVRISAAGALLDPVARPIAAGLAQERVAVASDGASFLVVWTRALSWSDTDVWGAIIAADGTTAKGPFVIASAPNEQRAAALAFGAGEYFVTWLDCRATVNGCAKGGGTPDIYGARVTPDGTVLDPNGVLVDDVVYGTSSPSVAFGGGDFVVVFTDCLDGGSCWNGTEKPYVVRVAPNATIAAPPTPLGAPPGEMPRVVAFSGGSLATWTAYDVATQKTAVESMPIEAAGAFGTPTAIVSSGEYATAAIAASSLTGALVLWVDTRDLQGNIAYPHLYGARLDTKGNVLDPGGFLVSSSSGVSDVASDGSGFVIAFLLGSGITRVDADGKVLDDPPIPVSYAAAAETSPAAAVAANGTTLFAWEDSRFTNGASSIRAARLDPALAMLDSVSLAIGANETAPAVGSNGSGFLVVTQWHDPVQMMGDVRARRIGLDGTGLDPVAIPLQVFGEWIYGCDGISVASDGASYAVVWDCFGMDSFSMGGAIVAANGTITASFHPPGGQWPTMSSATAIAYDGAAYLMAWGDSTGAMLAARIHPDGTPIDVNALVLAPHTSLFAQPSLSCHAGTCLVVWEDCPGAQQSPCPTPVRIGGVRVGPGGPIDLSPIAISTPGGRRAAPKVAFDGVRFAVAWEDDRNGASDLYGNWVSLDGEVLAPGDIPLSTTATGENNPLLVAAPGGGLTLGYQRFDPDVAFANVRVRARAIAVTPAPDGAPCVLGLDCTSETCAGGICCSVACGSGGAGGSAAGGAGGAGAGGSATGGAGGVSGAAGASGATGGGGGSSSGAGGTGSGTKSQSSPSELDGGCGCKLAGQSDDGRLALVVAALAVTAGARRRRPSGGRLMVARVRRCRARAFEKPSTTKVSSG